MTGSRSLRSTACATMHLDLAVALTVLVLGGCARTPTQDPPAVPVPRSPDLPVLGVAIVEPASDVADLSAAVRHVLRADGSRIEASPATEAACADGENDAAIVPADPGDGAAAPDAQGPNTAPSVAPAADPAGEAMAPAAGFVPGSAPRDAIAAAWSQYCVSTDLTPTQWGIIGRTSMPAALAARWVERCRPAP